MKVFDANKPMGDVSLFTVREYLRATGWIKKPTSWDDIVVYRRSTPEFPRAEIVVPKRESDFSEEYLDDIIQRLSLFDQRETLDVRHALVNPRVDKVKCRLISPHTSFGTTPLNTIQSFISGFIGALRAAVKDVVQPENRHLKLSSSEIDEMMSRAEFGQTEIGSFVASIFLPLGQADESDLLDEFKTNVFRKGVVHLMTALNLAAECAEMGQTEDFIQKNDSSGLHISSNLLDAVENARVGNETDVEFAVDWSPTVPVPEAPKCVLIKSGYSPYFTRWSQQLNPREDDKTPRRFVASIAEFSEDKRDEQGRPFGTILLTVFSPDEDKNYLAKVFLNSDQYDLAIDAFRNNDCVSFSGVRVWKKTRHEIRDVQNFQRVSQES